MGLPVAVAFSSKYKTYGFDIDPQRRMDLQDGYDRNEEFHGSFKDITFIEQIEDAPKNSIFIVTVPTPINSANQPELCHIRSATIDIASHMTRGAVVVYESTVYPGVVRDFCLPILEGLSGMKCPNEFTVGYSPERINPADDTKTIWDLDKLVAGFDDTTTNFLHETYSRVIDAPVHKTSSIEVAEMAKAIENAQRDINIAFVNEVALMCQSLGLNTSEVLKAAGTKWNFLNFKPGMVGGHCIPVDPYYLQHIAIQKGIEPKVISSARDRNDRMPFYIAAQVTQGLWNKKVPFDDRHILVLGLGFKANCLDRRNSPALKLIDILAEEGTHVIGWDPVLGPLTSEQKHSLRFDAIVCTNASTDIKKLQPADFWELSNGVPLVFDVPAMYDRKHFESKGINLWQL